MEKLCYALPDKAKGIIMELMAAEFDAVSFYTYLSFCCTNKGYFKAADYFMGESQSERGHFLRLSDFLQTRGIEPDVPAVKSPTIEFTDLRSGVEAAYKKEIELTEMYNEVIPIMFKVDTMAYLKLLEFMQIQEHAIKQMNDLWSMFENATTEIAQREIEEARWGHQLEPVMG